jgi:hypothetical protein
MGSRVASALCFVVAAGLAYATGVYEGHNHNPNGLMIGGAVGMLVTGTVFLFSRG